MQKFAGFVMSNWGNEMTLRWITNILVGMHTSLGVAVLVGGVYRFPYPTYQPLTDLVNGHTWLWGIWILASAGLLMIPTRWPQIFGLWFGMVWHIMWGVSFAVAVVKYPTASAAEAIVFGGLALFNAALLTARIVERDGG